MYLSWTPNGQKEREEEEVKCVPPLNPSRHLNLKGFLCLLGAKKAHRVTWSPTGAGWQRQKERRGWRRKETVKAGALGGRSGRERSVTPEKNYKKGHMRVRDIYSSTSFILFFHPPVVVSTHTHTHGVGICGVFSVTRVSTRCM